MLSVAVAGSPEGLWLLVQGVASRDIKLENTLLDGSPRPLLKICDFGYSKARSTRTALKPTAEALYAVDALCCGAATPSLECDVRGYFC